MTITRSEGSELPIIISFRQWFSEHGGYLHPSLRFAEVPSGLSVFASDFIPPDTCVVTCPFDLAITHEVAKRALHTILDDICLAEWNERQLVSTYICFHWILPESSLLPYFTHSAYLHILPAPSRLRTPLHFTYLEMEAFKGTNLYLATSDRKQAWMSEWLQCKESIDMTESNLAARFTWDLYLCAATCLSSRAFPSSVLSRAPSLMPSPTSHPVLLPGVDSLNHARGHPVTWLVSCPKHRVPASPNSTEQLWPSPEPTGSTSTQSISLVLHTAVQPGQEVFNNYGPKPNSEFILGYGFSLPNNPDDTIVLKIGIGGNNQENSNSSGKKWEVGRTANGITGVWEEIHGLIVSSDSEQDSSTPTFEVDLEAADILKDMVQALVDRLPSSSNQDACDLHPEVQDMLTDYVEGQRDILISILDYASKMKMSAIETAASLGIDFVFDDEDD